jgi:hypothetical protein
MSKSGDKPRRQIFRRAVYTRKSSEEGLGDWGALSPLRKQRGRPTCSMRWRSAICWTLPADLSAEALAKQLRDIRLVVDDQDADTHWVARLARGSRMVNSVNSPTSLSTSIVPPCCWVTMS